MSKTSPEILHWEVDKTCANLLISYRRILLQQHRILVYPLLQKIKRNCAALSDNTHRSRAWGVAMSYLITALPQWKLADIMFNIAILSLDSSISSTTAHTASELWGKWKILQTLSTLLNYIIFIVWLILRLTINKDNFITRQNQCRQYYEDRDLNLYAGWGSLCFSLTYLMRIVRVHYPGQPEVSNFEQQLVCVDEYVGRLQISVQDVSRVDELQSPQQLVEQQSSMTWSRAKDRYQDTPHCFYYLACNYFNNA